MVSEPRTEPPATVSLSRFLTKLLSPVPHYDNPPVAVGRYVLVEEGKQPITYIRQHPAMMTPAVSLASGALLATVIATGIGGDVTFILALWIIFGFLFMRSAMVISRWTGQYIVITDKAVILTAGFMTRTTTALPVGSLSGMTLERTPTGRITGFGAFRLGADSPVQLVIDYVPYPEQLYLEIRDMIRVEQEKAGSGE